MMKETIVNTFCPANRQQWREWLAENHDRENAVWLIYYKKKSNVPSLTWREAVDEALCFGWIDSVSRTLDQERFIQFFSRRKPKSVWSKINKEKVQMLAELGLMTKAGYEVMDIARQNGSWTVLDEVEELVVPADFQAELESKPRAEHFYNNLCKSDKRNLLQWLVLAKRPETRQNRIREIVESADLNQKPKIIQTAKKLVL